MSTLDYILDATKLSLKDIVTSIVNSRFIVDYGTVLKNFPLSLGMIYLVTFKEVRLLENFHCIVLSDLRCVFLA